jgi:nitroimidazol reductase NimA-like FMN-containing flavoprotein (pyridoxamine 5'-phosphate oxidase superfamily)
MKKVFKRQIVELLDRHRIMSVATNREDGWPQATVVGYCNDGLIIYSLIGRDSQKYVNITRDPRVSLAIANDYPQPLQIKGLSIAARAVETTDPSERAHAREILNTRSCRRPTRTPCRCCALRRKSSPCSITRKASVTPIWCA